MPDLDDVIKQGEDELEQRRRQRLSDITEGDVEVDPALLDVGDEVAEEVVSRFKQYNSGAIHLTEVSGKAKGKGGSASKFSPEQQRAAAQRAMDIAFEQMIPPTKAFELAGAEVGVGGSAVRQWAYKHGIVMEAENGHSARTRSRHTWDLYKRQALFSEMLDVAQLLIERVKVGLHFEATGELTGRWTPPDDWNPTNEFSKLAVPAAIAHDKLSHIEDLMITRGLRDVDSEELQGELKAGEQRLLEMESQ